MGKVWIDAALNGPWSRARQPGIPDDVEAIIVEGIACASAGACIIHAHAYDGGGPQTFDWRAYARIIEGIRAKVDVPVYPSIPMAEGMSADARFAHIEALAERGLLEFAVVDPGSVNFTGLEPLLPRGEGGRARARPMRGRAASQRRPISIPRRTFGMGLGRRSASASIRLMRSMSQVSRAQGRRSRR